MMVKSERRRRSILLGVRALPVEADAIRSAASEAGVSVSEFLRETALREASK